MKQYLLYIYDKIYNRNTPPKIKKIADAFLVTCAFVGSGGLIFSQILGEHHGIVLFLFWIGFIAKFASECCIEKDKNNAKP